VGAKRIQQRLMLAFVGVVVAALVPAASMLDRWIGDSMREAVRQSLEREAQLLGALIERAQPADVATWVAERAGSLGVTHLTVIDRAGRVLGDSDLPRSNLATADNLASLPEMRAALQGHVGSDERLSPALGKQVIHLAVPVAGGERALRLSLPLDQVAETVARAHVAVWLAGLMALVLALLLGATLSRWLTRPILAMTRAARAMSRGDFDATLPEPSDDELGDLVHALDTLRNQLAGRIAELRQEGVKLRAIVNGMSEGVALVQDGIVAVANPAFTKLLGLGAVEGRGFRDATRLPAVGDAIDAALVGRKQASREVSVGGRALAVQVDPVAESSAPQAVVVLIDVTEPKRLERLRREFVANASHELRTPVAAIVGVAETLAAGAADDPDARASFLEILMRHAQRLSRLTADLLDIARLEGGYRPRVETVALLPSVEAVLTTVGAKAAARSVTLVHHVAPALQVMAERAAVEQILTNLVDNAIKYTPPGGSVTVSASLDKDKVRVAVADTGPGIPRQHHQRLFERFYRVDDARSRDLGGTGLGLAIVKHLALANGGDVGVESDVGKGSRFIVSLPAAQGTLPS
jgi:two-component system, OmpR family, phosphate regulon sensor histidine kinase PhoR